MGDAYRFILLAIIIAANGFFAGAEVALLSTRKSRLRQLAETGKSMRPAVFGSGRHAHHHAAPASASKAKPISQLR